MTIRSLDAVFQALNLAGVRYLVVGGLAVVAHGYVRFTADVDLVIELEPDNVRKAMAALSSLGYRPRAPVPIEDLADPRRRAEWVREKGMTVFSLYSPEHAATEVDIFVEMPFDFGETYGRCVRLSLSPGVEATFVGLEDLIALKRRAGRPQDEIDIARLQAIAQDERE
jgi:predicted nucleotidyltransferase